MANNSQVLQKVLSNSKDREKILASLSIEESASILIRLPKRIQTKLISKFTNVFLIDLLEHLDPDETTDIVQLLPPKRREKIINNLSVKMREEVEILSKFDPQTAAGLMSLNYIQVEIDDTMKSVAEQFKTHEGRTGHLPMILVMDNGKLMGYLPIYELGLSSPDTLITKKN